MHIIPEQQAADENTPPEQLQNLARQNIELAQIVAKNPNTAPDLLQELASSSDETTRKGVAVNPNTPTDVLLRLGAEFPVQLLDNPMFSLLLLENLNLVEEIPSPTLRSILKQENVPLFILEQTADKADLEVQLALAMNAQTSKKVLNRLTQSRHSQVVESAHLHVNLVGELTETYEQKATEVIQKKLGSLSSVDTHSFIVLAQLCPIPTPIVEHWMREASYQNLCRAIAKSPATLPGVLHHLVNHTDSRTRDEATKNPKTPVDTLRHLSTKQEMGCSLASNPNTPSDVLERLVKHPDEWVRFKVAQNPNTPLALLENLASDTDKRTSLAATQAIKEKRGEYDDAEVFRNPKTPPSILEKLAQHNPKSVAKHPNAPPDLLLEFSKSKNSSLREAVAENPNAPVSILEKLARDDYSKIRGKVAKNPRIPLGVLFKQLAREVSVNDAIVYQMSAKGYDPESIRDLLAEESTSPLEIILQRLAKDGGMGARQFLAQRWDIPADLLEQLAQATEFQVRQAVAQNHNTTASCLEQLAEAKGAEVCQAVAQNPNTAIDTLEQLARDVYSSVRTNVAERINLPDRILEQLAGDEAQSVRETAMMNPCLSKEVVERILCGEYAGEYLKLNPDFVSCNPDSLSVALNRYAKSESPLVSYVALCQPQIKQELLQEKSRSIAWLERFAVAQNPQTSPELLKRLAEDSNQLVRAAARDLLPKLY